MSSQDNHKAKENTVTVLFVCIHNSGRSQMAGKRFSTRRAQGKGKALSAGTKPGEGVNPVVAEAMNEAGIDISANKPKALTLEMVEKAARMITMGCGEDAEGVCPQVSSRARSWQLEELKEKPWIKFG
jgi:protein-tyrosine-phosphatase